jgi:diaminopimelate decarboxylase
VFAGVPLGDLAREHGTPLFVFDAETVRRQCHQVRQAFSPYRAGSVQVCYAVKANGNSEILRVIAEEGLGADVASGGELDAALEAGFDPRQIVFNGNAKTDDELRQAIAAGIQAVIVDSRMELERSGALAAEAGVTVPYAVRVNPGTPGEGDSWNTAHRGSKFGIAYDQVLETYLYARDHLPCLQPVGVHCHVGSQIKEEERYLKVLANLVELLSDLAGQGIAVDFLDVGGGFPVRYLLWSDYDPQKQGKKAPDKEELLAHFDMAAFGHDFVRALEAALDEAGIRSLQLIVEPGRFVVASSGILLATVQTVKTGAGPDACGWVALDAGCNTLTDCWTYDWFFECLPVEGVDEGRPTEKWHIAGPLCDSGDVLGRERMLPQLERGDVVAFLQVGAYQLEQQSVFNLFQKAEVVVIE